MIGTLDLIASDNGTSRIYNAENGIGTPHVYPYYIGLVVACYDCHELSIYQLFCTYTDFTIRELT